MKIAQTQLTIYEVESFHQEILRTLESAEENLALDFSNVEKIDLCGVQLLLSLQKWCTNNNIVFSIIRVASPKVRQTFAMLNLGSQLELSDE